MPPKYQSTSRRIPRLFPVSDCGFDGSSSTDLENRVVRNVPISLQSTHDTSDATTKAPFANENVATKARTHPPPPYSAAGSNTNATASSSRHFAPPARQHTMDQQSPRGVSANFSCINPLFLDDVFAPSSDIERIFNLLKNDFGKLAADYANLQKFRDNVLIMARTVEDERRFLATERAELMEMREHMERERQATDVQYIAAAKNKDENKEKETELCEPAGKLKIREHSLREERSSAPPSASTEEHVRAPPSSGLGANFPLTVEQDNIPGLHSSVPTVLANDIQRCPSTGTHTLCRRSTVLHRTSHADLAIFGRDLPPSLVEVVRNDSITGDSPIRTAGDEFNDGAELRELCHTSSKRRDGQRGRSVRRVPGMMSIRDWEMCLD